jgi:septum formation protein
MRQIILASASPRRKEILKKTGLPFIVYESDYEEDNNIALEPAELAVRHSLGKALDIMPRYKNALVISADTIVVLGKKIFGKPRDEAEAAAMLKALSGKAHTVITGFTILDTAVKKSFSKAVETEVFFNRLDKNEIAAYIASGEPMDKAGAYGVQGLGAAIVRKIDGDFFNVMGLPLSELCRALNRFGITVLGTSTGIPSNNKTAIRRTKR